MENKKRWLLYIRSRLYTGKTKRYNDVILHLLFCGTHHTPKPCVSLSFQKLSFVLIFLDNQFITSEINVLLINNVVVHETHHTFYFNSIKSKRLIW